MYTPADERRRLEAIAIQEREIERRRWEKDNKTKNGPHSKKYYKSRVIASGVRLGVRKKWD